MASLVSSGNYAWRTPLCSRKCVDRFRARRASDRNWLPWLQIALDQMPQNRARLYDVSADLTTRQGIHKTAETLLRAAQTMTDRAIAGQLKALADD